jgi:phage shock protein C
VNPRRLYRSRNDRILAGVAGGMAEYFGIDPTVVRLLWILSILFGGFSILVYIILAFIVPLAPVGTPTWWGGPSGPVPAGAGYPGVPGQAPATEASGASEPAAAGVPSDAPAAAYPGWVGPGASSPAYAAPAGASYAGAGYAGSAPAYQGWAPARPVAQPTSERRPGRTGLYVGIVLIVFGSFAAIAAIVPGIGGGMLWAGFIVALGVAFLAGAIRRDAPPPADGPGVGDAAVSASSAEAPEPPAEELPAQ